MTTCLIEEQLFKAESSARSKDELTSLLVLLKIIVTNLLDNSADSKYKSIEKDSLNARSELLKSHETRDLLLLLGYHEKNDQYVYNSSDENMIKLQHCLIILEDHIKHQEGATLGEISSNKMRRPEGSQQISSNSSSCERVRSKEPHSSEGVKNLLLSRQLKKEQLNDRAVLINSGKRPLSRSSDFSFNTSGYFHQSSNSKDRRRNRSFIKELFHQQDHDTKGWSSSGFNSKLN